ncbi:hypothetical protein RHMOL_Rhmol07G0090500 [Rhododendron molle]|nr:hypothetical protein RHMOL_Rhmol07G0090500 [Rhododendron molle]
MALFAFLTSTLAMFRLYFFITSTKRRPCPHLSPNPNFYQTQVDNLNRLVRGNESDCYDQLRVNRHTFLRLCFLVRGVGLGDSRYVCLEERVDIHSCVVAAVLAGYTCYKIAVLLLCPNRIHLLENLVLLLLFSEREKKVRSKRRRIVRIDSNSF